MVLYPLLRACLIPGPSQLPLVGDALSIHGTWKMKEELSANNSRGVQRELLEESMEQVVSTREVNDVGESEDNLVRDESGPYITESFLVHSSSRSPILRADSVPVEGFSEVMIDGFSLPQVVLPSTAENDASQEDMEKWALDNAPPPIKLHREGETSEEPIPKELSPPPSPKRMREVERKGKVFSQGSI